MLEHYHNPPKDEAISVEVRIEQYLDALCEQLSGTLAEEQRREYRAEMREHLEAMIEAHQALGASQAKAVERALEQFGNAQRVAIAWEDVVELPERVSLRQALRTPVRWFGKTMLVWMTLFLMMVLFQPVLPYGFRDIAVLFWLFGMPLVAGWGTGLTTRGRPIVGTMLALCPLHLMLALFYWISAPLLREDALMITGMQFVSWSLVGATTAWLTHKERRRKWRKRKSV